MKPRIVAAAALLAAAVSARAGDDGKPAPAAPAAPAAPQAAAAAKHENKITPEAKAVFEQMGKVSNNPVAQGLKDASGTISLDMGGMTASMNFTFKAPATVHVEPDPNSEGPMKMMGSRMASGMERSLKASLGIYHPGDDEEYDASVATTDGKQVLTVTTFKDGAEQGRMDYTLDANGLPATGASRFQAEMNGQKHEMKSESAFTWTKAGDLWRLEKLESSMGGGGQGGGQGGRGGMGGGKVAMTFTYTDVEKFAIATSWRMEMPGGMAFENRISDLVVNGKKVEVKAPEAPKKDAAKMGKGKGEDDEEDEDEDEDEEHEKKHEK